MRNASLSLARPQNGRSPEVRDRQRHRRNAPATSHLRIRRMTVTVRVMVLKAVEEEAWISG